MRKLNSAGQSLAEFVIGLMLIASAFLAMQIYLQRGLQSRYRDGVQFVFSKIRANAAPAQVQTQYDPYYQESYNEVHTKGDNTGGYPDRSTDWTSSVSNKSWKKEYPPSYNWTAK